MKKVIESREIQINRERMTERDKEGNQEIWINKDLERKIEKKK